MLTQGVYQMHHTAIPHTVNATNHPMHYPDLAPPDYHFFISQKLHMSAKRFSTNEEVKGEVEK